MPKFRMIAVRLLVIFLALLFLPFSLFADLRFLNVFPDSPAVQGLTYTGQLSYTRVYTRSGSQLAPGLDEQEVFFGSLKHDELAGNGWEIALRVVARRADIDKRTASVYNSQFRPRSAYKRVEVLAVK